jgi:cytochrome c oxidase cbb3-type subunit 3
MASSNLHNKNICPSSINLCIHTQKAITSAIKVPIQSIFKTTFLLLIAGFFTLTYTLPVNAAADASTKTKKVAKGKQVFDQTCIYCHQADAIGKPGAAPSLTNKEFLSISSDKFLAETIRDGRKGTGMPPFGYLGDETINAVVVYLKSFAKLPSRVKDVEAQPKSTGNWQRGKKRFENICLGCHGPKGNGYSAGGTGTAIGKAGFLSKASDGFIRTTIKEGRSNTRMRSFQGSRGLANITNQEIEDIIAYLRTIPSKD